MAVADNTKRERPWLNHYPSSIPPSINYPEVPLYEFLSTSAKTRSDQTALVFFGGRTSYSALLDKVKHVAGGLIRLGLKKGDRVGIMLPNCPQAVESYFGALWAGATVVMINPLYTVGEIEHQIRDAGARFLIALDQTYPRVVKAFEKAGLEKAVVTGIQERLPFPLGPLYSFQLRRQGKLAKIENDGRSIRYSALLAGMSLAEPVHVAPKRDLALLQYTGGTTGTPKGVMLTHYNLVANCKQIEPFYPRPDIEQVTILGVLPFFHVYGMTTIMNYGVMIGARIVLLPRFEVGNVLKAVQKYRPQVFPGVPTMYVAINEYPGVEHFDLKSIQSCISGAAALPQQVKENFEHLTGGRLVEGYGLSEASPVTHCNPLEGTQKTGSIGVPLPDTECQLVDVDTGRPLPPGSTGELLVRGPQVMQGYWNKVEDTKGVLKDGWLCTGDIARMDEEGYFYIVDRKKEMINASGLKVYPREVEEVLYKHPAVREAAVIGVADSYRGETVKAFVVLKKDARCTPEEIVAWCKGRLAVYKVPKQVEFVQELPKSLIGKVLRRVLVEQEVEKQATPASASSTSMRKSGGESGEKGV